MSVRLVLSTLFLFLAVGFLLWQSAPRTMSDYLHSDDFVPASGLKVTKFDCVNWDFAIFNHCTVVFDQGPGRPQGQLEDWRFGRAPSDPIHLLQRRDDASVVTTDVSLRTLPGRIAFAATIAVVGLLFLAGLVIKVARRARPTS